MMVWPFGRKRDTEPSDDASRPPHRAGALPGQGDEARANEAIRNEILEWWHTNAPQVAAAPAPENRAHVGAPPDRRIAPEAPAGAVLRTKRGKLAWVDLYDPALRTHIDALVKHLDRQQKWYFNGVIATRYDEVAYARISRGK